MSNMWNEIMEQPDAISRCLVQNQERVRRIAREMKARDLQFACIAARGTSDHAAVYGKYVLEIAAGMPVSLAAASVFTLYRRSLRLKKALVVGVSQSGQAADVLAVIKAAKGEGALTVSITNDPSSPLAQEADFHLDCQAGVEKSIAATKTFTAEMVLFLMLASELAEDEALIPGIGLLPGLIRDTLYAVQRGLGHAARYLQMEECFVLARGINYPVALEMALKLQETAYVRAKGFSLSDFQHGPVAMLDRRIPVILIAPEGPSFPEMQTMSMHLKENDMEQIVITNAGGTFSSSGCLLETAKTDNDFFSPFLCIAAAQMFACRLSLLKGLDPDHPRWLKKVTVTY